MAILNDFSAKYRLKDTSIKTRIETFVMLETKTLAWAVSKILPLKQGLKQTIGDGDKMLSKCKVSKILPLKQGLKLQDTGLILRPKLSQRYFH